MRFIDSHTHLTEAVFAPDLEAVLARAEEAKVTKMNLVAFDLPSSQAVVDMAQKYDNMWAVIGVHPHDSKDLDAAGLNLLDKLLSTDHNHKIVAIGEIGLDYYYDNSPREIQKAAFIAQLQLAHRYNLPVVIHNRDAHADCLDILHTARAEGYLREELPGVIHCFSGSKETGREFIKLGFYLGFDGPVTFKNAKQPVDCVSSLPKDRIILETDCPYMAPVPVRGRRNEPAFIPHIAAKVAELWDMSVEEVAAITTANTEKVFRI